MEPDPTNRVLKPVLTSTVPIPTGHPPRGTFAIFSPRSTSDALSFYSRLAAEANDSLFMTFAFGMNSLFQDGVPHRAVDDSLRGHGEEDPSHGHGAGP